MFKTFLKIVLCLTLVSVSEPPLHASESSFLARASKKKQKRMTPKSRNRRGKGVQKAKPKRRGPGQMRPKRKGARKGRRPKPGLRFGVTAGGGMESITVQNADRDPDVFSGFGFGGGVIADYRITGCCSVWAGGGMHIGDLGSQNDAGSQKFSATSISIDAGLTYRINRSFSVGGIFQYLINMSASYAFESADENVPSTSPAVQNYNRVAAGGQIIYHINRDIFISADGMMIISGNITTDQPEEPSLQQDEPPSVSFSGFVAGGTVGYLF